MAIGFSNGSPLGQQEIAALRLVVRARGVVKAAQQLGINRHTLERGLAGVGIRRGSQLQIRLALATTDAQPERQP